MDPEIFFLSEESVSIRLDRLLTERYSDYSRTYFQRLIDQGFVLVNGEPVKKKLIPEAGDEIEVCFQYTPESPVTPENIPLEILYEDEYLLAINKPAGMVVHPAPGHRSGTFVNALLFYCRQVADLATDEALLRPGIVHRLDKDTTGVMLAAKTSEMHQKLVEQFSLRMIEKTYLALCVGKPQSGTVSAPIGRHPVHRKQMAIVTDGKEAITEIQPLAFNDKLSLVLAKPKTGRTHQIRVHLHHAKAPILGDSVYGSPRANQTFGVTRQMLHAYQIAFTHPITERRIHLTAPMPQDLRFWIEQISETPLP